MLNLIQNNILTYLNDNVKLQPRTPNTYFKWNFINGNGNGIVYVFVRIVGREWL
jgi:hypothetical protein